LYQNPQCFTSDTVGNLAWEQVKPTTISGCWAKGFDISMQVDSFAESNDLVEDIQAAARPVGIQDMDINNFINPTEQRVVDSTEDVIDLIVTQFNSTNQEEAEVAIVAPITTTEAIKALNILKQYQEQRIELINQDFMAYLRKELQDSESQRVNAQKQTTLKQWF
jgi:MoxR-like ATPase